MNETIKDDIEDVEDTLRDKYLTFHLAGEDYGVEIRHVTEIIGIQKITAVPNTPPYIRGVINLRGKVIPIMDVRARFGMKPKEYDERTCVIVARVQESLVGMVVDTVSEVVSIAATEIQAAPSRSQGHDQFIQGLGKQGDSIKILVDVARLLHDDDLELVSELSSSATA